MHQFCKWDKLVATALLLTLVWSTAWGQTPGTAAIPSAEQMVEQLKSQPKTQPRFRSLRNLTVEAADPAPPIAPAGAGTAEAAQQVETPKPSLSLSIQFDFNSSRIRAESFDALGNLATALQSPALTQSRFAVEGHTDAKGGADYNRRLSAQRAQAVKEFLSGKGVETRQLVTSGMGSTDLANPADPLAAENRRVRIVNLD